MDDRLRDRARVDLVLPRPDGRADPILFEHGCRVARLTGLIAALPEVADLAPDRVALEAAALYHDAGWILQPSDGGVRLNDLLQRPTSDLQRELAADWLGSRLAGIVAPGSLETAARAVRHCNSRTSDLLEARILADAENLDEIGPQTIGLLVRRQIAEGRTLDDITAAWRRQEEYHYWQARIKEGFRLAAVTPLAEIRLDTLRRFMALLEASLSLADLAAYVAGSADRPLEPADRS